MSDLRITDQALNDAYESLRNVRDALGRIDTTLGNARDACGHSDLESVIGKVEASWSQTQVSASDAVSALATQVRVAQDSWDATDSTLARGHQ